jgi:hypothetical protein
MGFYRKKPRVIEAHQWTGEMTEEMMSFLNSSTQKWMLSIFPETLKIETLEGWMLANKGDWIIKGVKNEIYPCKDDIFKETYEEVKQYEET